jgi:hypothetical protein
MPPSKTADAYLSQKYPLETLKKLLAPRAQWKPYPTASDRAAWEALPEPVRQAHIRLGEKALTREWPHLEATNYLQFARNGNRDRYEKPYFARRDILGTLVIAECMEGKGRFLDAITNAVWSICEESSWVLPAHMYIQGAPGLPDTADPVVDLFDGESAALVAWTAYLVGEQLQTVSPLILPRLQREIETRILTPNLLRDDFWWMGFGPRKNVNNWNPWINSNWLICALLSEPDEDRRAASVFKILRSLDRFLVPYPRDGGCDEGPGYWSRAGASVFDNLNLLFKASDGQIDEFGDALIREIGRFVYRAHIAGNFYLNFADASAMLSPDPLLVFEYGRRIADPDMTAFGAWLADVVNPVENGVFTERNIAPSLNRVLQALFSLDDLPKRPAQPPLVRDVFLPEIQVMVSRDRGGSSRGIYLAAKGGHNDESHNHNDIGNFVVYTDGKPLLVDVGVETYTRKTFSPQRYEIWTMQSAYHSLPTISGVMQAPGASFAARNVQHSAAEDVSHFALDIAAAYPPEAKLKTWQRTFTHQRGQGVVVEDSFEIAEKPSELTLSLMTPSQVDASRPGLLVLSPAPLAAEMVSGAGQVAYDPAVFTVVVEEINISDPRLAGAWGARMCRLLFTAIDPQAKGSWKITVSQ